VQKWDTPLKINHMTNKKNKKVFIGRNVILIILTFQISSCTGQVKEKSANDKIENVVNTQPISSKQSTIFPQIHTNLNGMVREFVRSMCQDTKGNYWFGTNGNGIICYNGQTLEKITIEGVGPGMRVMKIVEDKAGHVWFGTSDGLIKYDGEMFITFSKKEGLPGDDPEIWGLIVDKSGLIWVGANGGVCHFDGNKFTPFLLPETKVENSKPMLSDKLVFQFLEDKNGTIWLVTDGNGIFKYRNGEFLHLTYKNGLTDNNTTGVLEDKQGNIWMSTFYGGVSKYDGKTYTNFTKDGIIKGEETGGFLKDRKGNIWFTAENVGVYKYDGTHFTLYTIENGLTSNLVLSIFEDNKGQLWFGTWQGLCIFDGEKFVNAKDKEPWTN
jgi:ligand-binding sensor domain-containing protein